MGRIEVTTRRVYGLAKIYPANQAAKLLAEIAGTATLTERTLSLAHQMGFEIVVDADRTVIEHLAR